jgi:hypothetical protein
MRRSRRVNPGSLDTWRRTRRATGTAARIDSLFVRHTKELPILRHGFHTAKRRAMPPGDQTDPCSTPSRKEIGDPPHVLV